MLINETAPVPTTAGLRPTCPSDTLAFIAGSVVFAAAYGWLIITGNNQLTASADDGAAKISLWEAAIPPLAAILLARVVPARIEPEIPLADVPRKRLRRETLVLVALGIGFPLAALGYTQSAWYYLIKVGFLFAIPLIAFRLLRSGAPAGRAIPRPVVWLAPVPAVVTWFVLSQVWPFGNPLTQELPDPITLAVVSLLTMITAGVLEEVFYRGFLQTRLEQAYGRWPAIMASSLLFVFMHLDRVQPEAPLLGVATIIAFQGMFGLMQGYLWSLYRNMVMIIAIHVLLNLIYVDLLFGR